MLQVPDVRAERKEKGEGNKGVLIFASICYTVKDNMLYQIAIVNIDY